MSWRELKTVPLYDYKCSVHGVFVAFNSMEDYRKDEECPICKKPSIRLPSLGVSINMNKTGGIARRTDIELNQVSMGDSIEMFKRKKEERRVKKLGEKMLKKSEFNKRTLNYR